MSFRETLIEAYLDYLNNYLTVLTWARDNHLSEESAREVLDRGKALHRADTDPAHPANVASDFNPHR